MQQDDKCEHSPLRDVNKHRLIVERKKVFPFPGMRSKTFREGSSAIRNRLVDEAKVRQVKFLAMKILQTLG